MTKSSETKSNNISRTVVKSPILWGVLASAAFYGLIHAEVLDGQFVRRYFVSHPVEYIATTMFLIGLSVLLIKGLEVLGQYPGLSQPLFEPVTLSSAQSADDCDALLERLDRLPSRRQNEHIVRRLREAIEHVRRRGSADSLDEQLKYLADLDAARAYSSFALVRVIIWAIPILGFLGTVIGITLALANLVPDALEDSLPLVMQGLYVAFDTTALALSLSIGLMFAQFYVDQKESALLDRVDQQAAAELEDRFEQIPSGLDGQLVAVRRMGESMVQVSERLVHQQVELWQHSMETAAKRWTRMADETGGQLQTALSAALVKGLRAHAQQLAAAEGATAEQNHRHWDRVQQTQVQSTQAMASLQAALANQADMLGRAVKAAGEVTRLEDTLNRNLATLAGAKNFEQTVMSLAAAIHLLNARLADGSPNMSSVKLQSDQQTTHAA